MANIFTIILVIIIVVILLIWQFSNLVALYFGAPYIRISRKAFKEVLELAEIKPHETFYDLDCSWGEIIYYVSKKYHIQCYGIEVSPLHYLVSSILNLNNKLVKIYLADFNDFNLDKADITFCHLTPKMLKKMEEKFLRELESGSRLITYRHALPKKEPQFIYQAGRDKIYFYQF